jgi:hypothetical protein
MSAGWNDVLVVTEAMLGAARAEAWDQLATLEDERRALIAALPSANAEARDTLSRIGDADRLLVQHVAAAREDAAELLRRLRQLEAGANAYLGVAFGR